MRRKITIDKKNILDILIAFFICAGAIKDMLGTVTSHPALLTAMLLFALLLLYFFLVGLNMRDLIKLIVPVLCVFFLILLTWILYPERHLFYKRSLYNIWDLIFPTSGIYLMSVSLLEDKIENYISIFGIVAYLMFAICLFQSLDPISDGVWTKGSIYNGEIVIVQSNYNLNWGYNMFIPCIIFLGLYMIEQKKMYLIYILIGMTEILLYGSRGPLLTFAVFLSFLYIFYSAKNKNRRGCIAGIFVIIIAVLAQFGILQNAISNMAEDLNFSSRTLDKLLSGSLLDDSRRNVVYLTVITRIAERPFLGWGIYSDRYFMNTMVQGGSAYSHNLFLEMMISFGIFGLLFMVYIVWCIIKVLSRTNDEHIRIVILICIGGCLPLMLSLTFWNHSMFWILLAILIHLRKYKEV